MSLLGSEMNLKYLLIVVIIILSIYGISFFYDMQLGAIPFLILSIFFIYIAWQEYKKGD